MGEALPAHQMLARAMQQSFRNWGTKDPQYKRVYRKLTEDGIAIVDCALLEMIDFKPASYDLWWLYEHMRFTKTRNEQARLAQELAYNFLCKFVRGDLRDATSTKKSGTSKPKAE